MNASPQSTSGPHEHQWAADSFHSGFGCVDCQASYWDWSQAELSRLRGEVQLLQAQSVDHGYCQTCGMNAWAMASLVGRLQAERATQAAEVDRLNAEVQRLAGVVEAAKAFRQAKIETSKHGWSAVLREAPTVEALFKALIALDAEAPAASTGEVTS